MGTKASVELSFAILVNNTLTRSNLKLQRGANPLAVIGKALNKFKHAIK
jgi:hypothetical protein